MVSTAYREQCRVMVAEARQVEGEDTHQMVIAARERSRNGDELNLRGVDFQNYLKNPVVLWSHDSFGGISIGKTLEIDHDDKGRIVADFQFNSEDEFAARVENARNGGFIRAASIRFMPTKVVEMLDEQGRVDRLRIEESELLEWSLVAVPADPDSVRAAARAMNLPEEIFRGFEPEPEDDEAEPPTDPVTDEPEPGPKREVFSQLIQEMSAEPRFGDLILNRIDALEEGLRELAARDSTTEEEPQEPQESPSPEEPEGSQDPMLAAIGAQFAAMRQIMEEK